jgi:[acyl-carrier-protein] S-malonyltransferase
MTTLQDRPVGGTGTPGAGGTAAAPRLVLWSAEDAEHERWVRGRLFGSAELAGRRTVVRIGPAGHGTVRAGVVTTPATAARDIAGAPVVPPRPGGPRPVALLFPGQGSQHPGMLTGLAAADPRFRRDVDRVLDTWGEEGRAIRSDWLAARPRVELDDARRAQPLLFTLGVALGAAVLRWGVEPAEVLGHSAGELVAAALTGVLAPEAAARMVRDRVAAAVDVPAGGMLAVAASVAELAPHLTGGVGVAAVNAARQTMLAGPTDELAAVAAVLAGHDLVARAVPATTPFHSAAMEPAVERLLRDAAPPEPGTPWCTLVSGYTAAPLRPEDARCPRFWARQLADTVRFGPALDTLLARGDRMLLETGPGQVLSAFARRHRSVRSGRSTVVSLAPGDVPDRRAVLEAALALWLEGHPIDPDGFPPVDHPREQR